MIGAAAKAKQAADYSQALSDGMAAHKTQPESAFFVLTMRHVFEVGDCLMVGDVGEMYIPPYEEEAA